MLIGRRFVRDVHDPPRRSAMARPALSRRRFPHSARTAAEGEVIERPVFLLEID
jgi:hypothetical protein